VDVLGVLQVGLPLLVADSVAPIPAWVVPRKWECLAIQAVVRSMSSVLAMTGGEAVGCGYARLIQMALRGARALLHGLSESHVRAYRSLKSILGRDRSLGQIFRSCPAR
jgi:hypothetical protein